MLDSIDDISGAKRKENLTNHAEDARVSKHLATAKRDIPLDGLDVAELVSQPPDRSRLREVFREFELREPLRRLEEALGSADAAAPAPVAEHTLGATLREGSLRDVERLPQAEVAVAVRPPLVPEGALFAENENEWRYGVYVDETREVIVGTVPQPEQLVQALGTRPVIAHDAKSLGLVPANLVHDTEVAAYLLEPAARAYPFRELCEDRGLAADVSDEAGVRRRARPGARRLAARGDPWPRASPTCSTTSSCRSCGSCAAWS